MTDDQADEEMVETAAKLDSAMDVADEGTESESGDSAAFAESLQRGLRDGLAESIGAGTSDSTGGGLGEQFGRLVGELVVRTLSDQIRRMGDSDGDADLDPTELLGEVDGESLSEAVGDSVLSGVKDDIEDGQSVIEEAGELLETVDVGELTEAVDVGELPSVVDTGEVPAAIANADPKRAIELKQLASLVEFGDLWDAVDVREFVRNKNELEDAADDVTDDDGDADDSGMLDSVRSDSTDAGDDSGMMDSMGSSESSGGDGTFIEQEEAMQAAIQSKLRDAIEEFRGSVLDAREQLKGARDTAQETVEEKTGGGTGQPSSRNPTAYSTMVSGWKSGGWSSSSFSTVPQTTQHSSAPGHYRIYGRRFDELEETEDDDE